MFLPEPVPELFAQLAQETYSTDLLHLLVVHIARFDFEARKDVVQIFNNLLRRQIGARWPTVEYISGKREVLFAALGGYENEDVALNTGMILREMLRHEPLCKILLHSEQSAFIHVILPVLAIDRDIFIGSTNTPITSRQQHLEFPRTHTQASRKPSRGINQWSQSTWTRTMIDSSTRSRRSFCQLIM
jgi:Mo25-like